MSRNTCIRTLLARITLAVLIVSGGAMAQDKGIKIGVVVVLEKLPLEKQEKMADFQTKLSRYINNHEWLENDDFPLFKGNLQVLLEDIPSNIEDRYRCSLVISGPDIQFMDQRANFAFQKGELLEHDGQGTSFKHLIDFYVYLLLANEIDKLGYLEGTPYFQKARQAVEQGKFVRFVRGWDQRAELMNKLEGENHKKFREMKDYYFYALATIGENEKEARQYMAKAVSMLRETLKADANLDPAKDFISAHYQEVIDVFKDTANKEPIRILKELDHGRAEIYDEYLD